MKVQRTELLARLDAAEKDTARYRWLRHANAADISSWLPRSDRLDAVIDAAMKGKP